MGRKKHLDQLREFKIELSKEIKIDKLILFGSRAGAGKKPTRWSDFDLLIVSPDFRKKKTLDRGIGFYKHWDLDYPVDFLCYTPEEFEELRKKVTLVREATQEGVEI